MTGPSVNRILLTQTSSTWRRRLGPMAWAVLEELALAARPTEQGWTTPVGVRYLGTVLGITKNTAARAITTLRSAGLVLSVRVEAEDGRHRTGYRLDLPDGITVRVCPSNQDTAPPEEAAACPEGECGPSAIIRADSTPTAAAGAGQPSPTAALGSPSGDSGTVVQCALFDNSAQRLR